MGRNGNLSLTDVAGFIGQNPRQRFVIEATGRSMIPSLVKGDRIVVGMPDRDIKRGDIVLCRLRNSNLALHRVVGTDPLATAGDFMQEDDGPVDEVLGLVYAVRKTWMSRLRRLYWSGKIGLRKIAKLDF